MNAAVVTESKQTIIDRELNKIFAKKGELTPDILLDEASKKQHPLHSFFEWDDKIAGHQWRRDQALQMIMAAKMVETIEQHRKLPSATPHVTMPVRAWLHPVHGEGFVPRGEVNRDAEMRAAMIEKHRGKLRSWCAEVVDLPELAKLRALILQYI